MTPTPLLPCPFCGGMAEVRVDESSDYRHNWSFEVGCFDRDCSVAPTVYPNWSRPDGLSDAAKHEAVATWNRRYVGEGHMSSWLEVIEAVEHTPGCMAALPFARRDHYNAEGDIQYSESPGPCDCTRDARIAKGFEAAICTAVQRTISNCDGTGDTDNDVAAVFTAFKEAAQ